MTTTTPRIAALFFASPRWPAAACCSAYYVDPVSKVFGAGSAGAAAAPRIRGQRLHPHRRRRQRSPSWPRIRRSGRASRPRCP